MYHAFALEFMAQRAELEAEILAKGEITAGPELRWPLSRLQHLNPDEYQPKTTQKVEVSAKGELERRLAALNQGDAFPTGD